MQSGTVYAIIFQEGCKLLDDAILFTIDIFALQHFLTRCIYCPPNAARPMDTHVGQVGIHHVVLLISKNASKYQEQTVVF